jgi:hypothetical protein
MAEPFLQHKGAAAFHASNVIDPTAITVSLLSRPGNFDKFRDRGPLILGVATGMTASAILLVLARVYVRLRMTRSWGLDDYAILVALVSVHSLILFS